MCSLARTAACKSDCDLQSEREQQLDAIAATMDALLEQLASASALLGDASAPSSSLLATNIQRIQMALDDAQWAQTLVASTADVLALDTTGAAAEELRERTLEFWGCLSKRSVEHKYSWLHAGSPHTPARGRRLQQAKRARSVRPSVAKSRQDVPMRTRSLFDRCVAAQCHVWSPPHV